MLKVLALSCKTGSFSITGRSGDSYTRDELLVRVPDT